MIKDLLYKKKIYLMNTADHNNLGDHALAIAGKRFLEDTFSRNEVVEITGREWDHDKEKILSCTSDKDVICIVGGGFMGDLWEEEDQRVKEILSAFIPNPKIMLPQSFYYMNKNKQNEDLNYYRDLQKLLVIHREKHSFSLFEGEENGSRNRHVCFPDMALYLYPYIDRGTSAERKGLMLCLRKDKESVLCREEIEKNIKIFADEISVTVTEVDTVVPRDIKKEARQEELNCLFRLFMNSKIVITDRLHGMLFSYLTGTPCIALNNISGKVEGVAEWIAGSGMVKVIDEKELTADLLNIMMGVQYAKKDTLLKEFRKMKGQIKRWAR